jgi:tryptophan synthase alpha chain
MSTYKETFGKLDRAALIPFFVIGDPDFDTSLEIVKSAIDAGADILELGIPFSDPIADGPTIQKADIRSLKAGMNIHKALDFIAQVTAYKPVPIGLLVYYNLIYQYGVDKFFADFKAAGGSSVLVADMSIDDADEVSGPAEKAGLETVFMVTPNTTDERVKLALADTVEPLIKRLKGMTDVPICVGFGISSADHAKQVAGAGADGVIIGSRIVSMIEDNLGDKEKIKSEVGAFIADVAKSLK